MLANYHTHTWRCNHATGTEEEYVTRAIDRGLELFGFSDHTPYIFPGDYYSTFRMKLELLDDYVDTVLALREKYSDRIQIPLGLEIEYYPDLIGKLLPILRDKPIDYLLLGQHFVGNEMDEPYSGRPARGEEHLSVYCRQVAQALNTGLFTYLAHPDLLYYPGDRKVYQKHMALICREAKQCDIPLEFNLAGLACGKNYPNPCFWELAAEEGNRVVLGMDAHRAEDVSDTALEQRAMELLGQLGIQPESRVTLRKI